MLNESELISDYVKRIKDYVNKGGPDVSEWEEFNQMLIDIYTKYGENIIIKDEQLKLIYLAFGDSLTPNTLQGHVFNQPYGYPGDFDLIDKLYTKKINNDFYHWDFYGSNLKGLDALRGRIEYLHKEIKLFMGVNHKSILNIASGPCRDIKEYFAQNPNSKIQFDCVEFDERAIEYAKVVLDGFSQKVNFIHKNALRFITEKKYDLIWSGGLFDYFDDKVFVRLLKRYATFLKEGAEIIVGNFSPANPSKAYMELMNWHLNYRDKEHLLRLADESGFEMKNVWVDSEPLGINLFLHYRNVK